MEHLPYVGYLGIAKIKRNLWYYTLGNTAGLKNIANNRDTYHECQHQHKDESPIPHDIPTIPWTKLDADLLKLKEIYYILMLIILQSILILVYFQVNNLLPLVLVQKDFFFQVWNP